MKIIKNVYLSGLGAIGSAYASRIQDFDPNCLKIICSSERIKRYTGSGISVNSKSYSFNYLTPADAAPPADLIIISVKQHHLAQAIEDIKPFVGQDTVILSLLNGISSEEILGREFGMEKLLHSFVVGTDAVRLNTSTSFSSIGKIVFGDAAGSTNSDKVNSVKEFFDNTQIPYSIPENILRELWWKFMLNVGINQTSAVLKAPYGIFQQISEARELMISASMEVVQISQKAGINLKEDDITECIRIINTLSPEGKTSMLQDVEAGRKTEVEIFSGTVLELGKLYGIVTPVNEMLYKMISVIERMN